MKLPDPSAPVISHSLSADQCVIFTNIILTWGAAEDELGAALLFLYGIHEGWIANDLVISLNAKKKAELLYKAFKRLHEGREALPVLKDILRAQSEWADDRNVLAHGFGAVGESGTLIVSSMPKSPIPVSELGRLLARANWLYLACSEVRRIAARLPSDGPLPDIPP
jgi:hypothetical protein